MNKLKKFLNGIDFKNAIVASIVAIVLTGLSSWLSKNNWHEFSRSHTISFSYSVSGLTVALIFILILTVLISGYISNFRKLEIIEAKYGVTGRYVDVTAQAREMIDRHKLDFPLTNGITGGYDPAEGTPKHATIRYKYGNKEYKTNIPEGERVIIPR